LVFFLCGILPGPWLAAQEDPLLEASRALAQRFGQELQTELKAALVNGGPAAAVSVCRDAAPRIASALSREAGAKIGRTSLLLRNPINTPEPWQANVLTQYFQPTVLTTDKRVEYFARSGDDVRYMQAIRTGGLCLTCHGQDLDGALLEQLDTDYPHDQARGYELGVLRGAFSITWPQVWR
jgi:hypothetical protein